MFAEVSCPQLDAWAQSFYGIVYYVVQSTNVESLDFLARLVLEVWKREYWVLYSGDADIGVSNMHNFQSMNPKMITAVVDYFDGFWWDKSISSVLW